MTRGKKLVIIGLAALSLSAMLSGCKNMTQKKGAGGVTLEMDKNLLPDMEVSNKKVRYYFAGSQETVNKDLNLMAAIGLLKEQYGVDVEFEFAPAQSYPTKLSALVAGGNPPDLVSSRDNADLAFIENKLIQPIEQHFDMESKLWSEMKAYMGPASWNGVMLSMPMEQMTNGVFVYSNKKLFDEAGLDYPSTYAQRGEWNWDTLLELAQDLTVAGAAGKPEVYGYADHTAYGILCSIGLDLVTQDEKGKFIGHLGNPVLTEAMNFYYDLGPKKYNVLFQKRADEAFPAGKVAMVCDNSSKLSFFKDMLGYIDIAPIPAYPKSEQKYISNQIMRSPFICKSAENIDGAVAFINCSRLVQDTGNTRETRMAVIQSYNSAATGEDFKKIVGDMVDMYEEDYVAVEPRASKTLYSNMSSFWTWSSKLTQPWSTLEASWKDVFQTKVDELNKSSLEVGK